jgi:uncharacterized SAM-binding protein YcdF (DUF218 family)
MSIAALALATRIAWFPTTIQSGSYDAAVVLGARASLGQPTPVFAARIDHAVDLYKRGIVRNILFTGGNEPSKPLTDSEAARDYAVRHGVPREATEVERKSRTTRENLIEAQRIVRDRGWGNVVVVSDPYHLYRASWQAAALELDADFSATPTTAYRSVREKVPFLLRETYFNVHFWVFRR